MRVSVILPCQGWLEYFAARHGRPVNPEGYGRIG